MVLKVDDRRAVDGLLVAGTDKVFKKRTIDPVAFIRLAADFLYPGDKKKTHPDAQRT